MTLNITVTTSKYVCQVSDRRLRRLRRDGRTELFTDQANKSTILRCRDAVVAVTYQGIGEDLSTTRTDVWLVGALQKSRPTDNSIKKVLEEFREQSSEWMNNLRRCHRGADEALRHTFVFAGWVNQTCPTVFCVSNYENLKTHEEVSPPWPEFVATVSRPMPDSRHSCSLYLGGAHAALEKGDTQLLTNVIQKEGAQPKDVINIMVRAVQNAAQASSLVGENCTSTLLLPGQHGVECDSHSPSGTPMSYMPNIVGKISMWGIEILAGNGTPAWRIREAIPQHMTKAMIVKGLRQLPVGYRTGDKLPLGLDRQIIEFLEALPPGITEHEIRDVL